MRLYHFALPAEVLPIKERGLLPSVDFMTLYHHPVVWLTTQPDVSLSADEGAAAVRLFGWYEAPLHELHRVRAELHRVRADEIETFACRPPTQWKYGSEGECFEYGIEGRKVIVRYVPPEDDLVRMTVEVPEDGRLHRYVNWRDRPKTKWFRDVYQLPFVRRWYVYLGSISPQLITEVMSMPPPKTGQERTAVAG